MIVEFPPSHLTATATVQVTSMRSGDDNEHSYQEPINKSEKTPIPQTLDTPFFTDQI